MRIEITGMTYGANAVGRADDGKVMFVAGGAPGDVVITLGSGDVYKQTKKLL